MTLRRRTTLSSRIYRIYVVFLTTLSLCVTTARPRWLAAGSSGPYARQVAAQIAALQSSSPQKRAGAAEALGFLRAYEAEDALIGRLDDRYPLVRREAAMSLAWCGSRKAVGHLLDTLDDPDWVTRQAAHVSLTNITGMEFPFDALAASGSRKRSAEVWRNWWRTVPPDRPPTEAIKLIKGARHDGRVVTASSTYKGPPAVLCDRAIGPEYWQTKDVPFPQSCTIDLGRPVETSRVVIHQYGPRFVMTEYELATSLDGQLFDVIERKKGVTPVKLVVDFRPRPVRHVRVTSHDSRQRRYPTTFFEIEINGSIQPEGEGDPNTWRHERGLRALGALGGRGATEAILACLGAAPTTTPSLRPVVRAGIRALGRLRDEAGLEALIRWLDHTHWARHAATALGDLGDRRAVPALIRAYPRYAKQTDGKNPRRVPPDDRMTFPSEDRMLETPYAIAYALCRLPLDSPEARGALRKIAPLIMANLPGDHDTFMLYEPEVGHLLTQHLMEKAGLRESACEHAFEQLGQPRRLPAPDAAADDDLRWPVFDAPRLATWLPALCTANDVPRLVALLGHADGWIRINAAKALGWLGDRQTIAPLERILEAAPPEAAYGYSGRFKDEEYADPAPRWREGILRALGKLGAHALTDRIIGVLEDKDSVVEVRHAAAMALADLGNAVALAALKRAAVSHPFHSIRHVARDALRYRGIHRGIDPEKNNATRITREATVPPRLAPRARQWNAIVFIQGDNNIPNTIGTVEQADRWRQTYVVTDSGPAYRPGRNLVILRPASPDGTVTPLTDFASGYVAEPELSWDGTHVIFARRGEDHPWWHVYRINLDGSGLEQLTHGPFHDVGPAYLPDGRIVFSSSRSGIRDEYHGYPCTALYVMNSDGSDIHPIATNIGRDNEPAVLNDGRIVFSRLEVFYSRNKTELTLHAARPDGTRDEVLYGPERRSFWYRLDHGPRTPADGQESPLTHRVIRMTQPQPMPSGHDIIVVTQGGLVLVGPRRDRETIITTNNKRRAYTTPFPLPDGRVLCASTRKTPDREKVDLGLYIFDPTTKQLRLVYNDPQLADFEPRPILARPRPPILPENTRRGAYSGRFLCQSVFTTQERDVATRGRLVRLVEGMPMVARHSTQANPHPVWKNHGGTLARVLGTAPLAADGSFFVEAPADRLLHFQVLDSDRRVLGNQKTWIYTRPGETRSCVGCHQDPHITPSATSTSTTLASVPLASLQPPIDFRPTGDEFKYRAKAWFKGHLPPEIEARTRTVRAVNLLAR